MDTYPLRKRTVRRIFILVSAIVMQTCLGGIYAWSVFVSPLKQGYGLDSTQTQLLFGGCILIFTLSMVIAGRFLERIGPRWMAAAGGVLFALGYWVASLSGGTMPLLFLGVSILTGIGIGLAYVCPIVTCMRWFPKIKGLVTGLAVAGFGGGAVVLSNLGSHWLSTGVDVLQIFGWVGLSYGALIVLAAMSFTFPPAPQEARQESAPIPRILTNGRFWRLCAGMFAGTFAGLLTIGNLKPIGEAWGVAENYSVMAVSLLALGNAAGRIAWGFVFDRVKTRSIPLSLAFLSLAILFLLVVGSLSLAFVLAAFLIGFGFGACFVVYASAVDHYFGAEHVGRLYPRVFLAYGLSGILGPTLGGSLFDLSGSYSGALIVCALLPVLAIGLSRLRAVSPVRTPEAEA